MFKLTVYRTMFAVYDGRTHCCFYQISLGSLYILGYHRYGFHFQLGTRRDVTQSTVLY